MHQFDYKDTPKKLLTPSIVSQIAALHEYKGKQDLYISVQVDTLSALLEIAKIQSTKASNSIEGIYTSDERLHALVVEKLNHEIAQRKKLLAIEKYSLASMRTMSTFPFAPTTYCNYIVTFTPSVEKKLVDVSRTQIISSQKQTERGKSISDLSLFLHSKRQKR